MEFPELNRGPEIRSAEDSAEMLRELTENGEAMIDVGASTVYRLRERGFTELADAFNVAYTDFYNDDTELPDGMLDEVCKALTEN